jgi:hypothetical protein
MLCNETNHLWLGRFSTRLVQLRQDISWRRAVMRAVAAHPYLSDLAPEKAALLESRISMASQGTGSRHAAGWDSSQASTVLAMLSR